MTTTKGLVLRDMNTNNYYTGDYRQAWSKDYADAKRFGSEQGISETMENDPDLFEVVCVLEIVSVLIPS